MATNANAEAVEAAPANKSEVSIPTESEVHASAQCAAEGACATDVFGPQKDATDDTKVAPTDATAELTAEATEGFEGLTADQLRQQRELAEKKPAVGPDGRLKVAEFVEKPGTPESRKEYSDVGRSKPMDKGVYAGGELMAKHDRVEKAEPVDYAAEVREASKDEPQTLDGALDRFKGLTDGKMGTSQESFDKALEKFKGMDIPEAEKVKALNNLSRMMEKADNGEVTHDGLGTGKELSENMRTVVAGAMDNIVNPRQIHQGDSTRCNAVTMMEQTFSHDPAKATEMLSQIATTGQLSGQRSFREGGPNGTGEVIPPDQRGNFTVNIPKGIFTNAIREGANGDQFDPNKFTAASRLLTGGMINHVKQQYGDAYTEIPPQNGKDTGERSFHMDTGKTYRASDSPRMDLNEIAAMGNTAGMGDKVAFITSENYADTDGRGLLENVKIIKNPGDIDRYMAGKKGGIISGNSGDRLMTGRDGLNGGGHVVSLYNQENGKYTLSDQYNSARDRVDVGAKALFDFTSDWSTRHAGKHRITADASDYGRTEGVKEGDFGEYGYKHNRDKEPPNSDAHRPADRGGPRYYRGDEAPGVDGKDDPARQKDAFEKQKEEEDRREDPENDKLKKSEADGVNEIDHASVSEYRGRIAALQQRAISEGLESNIYGEIRHLEGLLQKELGA